MSGHFASRVAVALFALVTVGCADDGTPRDLADVDARGDASDLQEETVDGQADAVEDIGDARELDMPDADGFESDVPCEAVVFDEDGLSDVAFTVGTGSEGFLWTVFAQSQSPEVDSITPPAGIEVPAARLTKLFESQAVLSEDAVSILLTHADVSDVVGEWSATVSLREPDADPRACATLLQKVPLSDPDALLVSQLAARFVLVADPDRFAERPQEDVALARMTGSAGSAVATLGVELRPSGWAVAPVEIRERFGVLFDEGELDALIRLAPEYLGEASGKEVIVFLVEGFADGFGGSGGISVGQSGSIPGAPASEPSDAGAIVVSLDGVEQAASAQYLGKVLGHELGHFLGLSHTTEQSGNAHDALSDTPECGSTIVQNYTQCEDSDNLMFPLVRPNVEAVSSALQRSLVRGSPLVVGP